MKKAKFEAFAVFGIDGTLYAVKLGKFARQDAEAELAEFDECGILCEVKPCTISA